MKDPVLAVITILKVDTSVAALAGARVYRAVIPNSWKIGDGACIAVVRVDKMQEEPTSTGRYATARIQCTVCASSDYNAENLSDLILAALESQQNTIASGVYIVDVDDAGSVPDNSDANIGVFRDSHDFKITYLNH